MLTPQRTLIVALLVLLSTLAGCAPSRLQLGRKDTQSGVSNSNTPCAQRLLATHGPDREAVRIGFDREIAAYQELAEKSLSFRAATIKLASRLKEKIEQGQPLSGADLDTLNQGIVAHLQLRNELYAVAQAPRDREPTRSSGC